jgi:hypothetical protein
LTPCRSTMFRCPHRAFPSPANQPHQGITTDSSDSTSSWIGSNLKLGHRDLACHLLVTADRGQLIRAGGERDRGACPRGRFEPGSRSFWNRWRLSARSGDRRLGASDRCRGYPRGQHQPTLVCQHGWPLSRVRGSIVCRHGGGVVSAPGGLALIQVMLSPLRRALRLVASTIWNARLVEYARCAK